MQNKFKLLSISCLALFCSLLYSCSEKEVKPNSVSITSLNKEYIPTEIIENLENYGFETSEGLYHFREGYLVENDIYLTTDEILLLNKINTSNSRIHQYHSDNLVSGISAITRTINVHMDTEFDVFMQNAFDIALARYNALDIRLNLVRSNESSANIVISAFYEETRADGSIILGYSAGFPRNGNPASGIGLNTFVYNTSSTRADATTVIAHEIGHAIGFRHTDHMNRSFSCVTGGAEDNSEGANHIPGTPTGPESDSWMLACNSGWDRPFTSNDVIAIESTYGANVYRNFIENLYLDLNKRIADAPGLQYWSERFEVESNIYNTLQHFMPAENYGIFVKDQYTLHLSRTGDSGGVSHWINNMKNGYSREEVIKRFCSETEYWNKSGQNNSGFVDRIYQTLLNRSADASGKSYWVNRLNNGLSRYDLVNIFLHGTEYKQKFIESLYINLLGRNGDSSGVTYWVNRLNNDLDQEQMIMTFISSAEYWNKD